MTLTNPYTYNYEETKSKVANHRHIIFYEVWYKIAWLLGLRGFYLTSKRCYEQKSLRTATQVYLLYIMIIIPLSLYL